MKKYILIVFILFINIIYSQENFKIQTEFKLKPNGENAVENYSFDFLIDQGKLIEQDLDLKQTKNYLIKYYNSSYSAEGDKYIVVYTTDFDKHFEEGNDKDDVYVFTIVYDHKIGNVLALKILNLSTKFEKFYLTKLGKEIRENEKN